LRSQADVLSALDAGADAIGLNLTAHSRRRIDTAVAAELAAMAKTLVVVWVIDASPPPGLTSLLSRFPSSLVQRTDARWAWPKDLADERRVGVVRLPEDTSLLEHFVISDAAGSAGGSGRRADWALSAALARQHPRVLLAGGLTSENVAEAAAAVKPFGVDVASGIERDGRPDAAAMRAFVEQAKGRAG
jgi:phosphoribosylanthranilate isomerase